MIRTSLALAAGALLFSSTAFAGTFGSFNIGAGFMPDPQTQTGTSGGSRDAGIYGGSCRGSIASAADHTITVTSTVNLKVFAESPDDSTLVITGPGGTFCDDDSHGNLNPEVNAVLTPGTYQVFVGEFGGGNSRYTLTLTENL